jgi:hypothetical protein
MVTVTVLDASDRRPVGSPPGRLHVNHPVDARPRLGPIDAERGMSARRLHPFDVIARVLTERLAGCEASDELRAMVCSRGIDWQQVVGDASDHYVLPAFAAALRDLDLIPALDEELGAFLDAVHAANAERNRELRAELAAAVAVLNRAGIEPVLLKGAIRLADGLYPDEGWRILRDLDLLVPQASLAAAMRAFQEAGYPACGSGGELRRRGGVCQIDLHTEIFSRLLPAADILEGARPMAFCDARVRIPSIEHQLAHLIGHSQIRHLGHARGHISLRDRLEAAALVRGGHAEIDWPAVFARFVAAGHRRPLLSVLLALNEGGWCAVAVTDRIDPLTALQQRRIALQARSTTCAYIGARVGGVLAAVGRRMGEIRSRRTPRDRRAQQADFRAARAPEDG